ncbi:MAG: hypothetical protein KF819_00255 [Labilithrix sp.]|nr:hypothetical protein [Labilithrix sp.]
MTISNGTHGGNRIDAGIAGAADRDLSSEASPAGASRLRARAPAPSAPLSRREGRVAEEAQLRARLELARVLGDHDEERKAGRKLAERLASRDVEIDAAIELATRTLGVADDPELRHALAGWLEGLGEPGLAASELRRLQRTDDPVAAAALLVRIGVLHARAGDPHGAQDAFAEAAELDEEDPLPLELLGAIAGWSPPGPGASDGLTPRAGAEAYVRAARRRARTGDADAELEDLLRAFELDPTSPVATAALVAAHGARDRASAADEVLRAHANALGDEGEAAEVHARRRTQALERGDLGRALAAAFDEGVDSSFDAAESFDDLLLRAGAFEMLAVRLEVRGELAIGDSRVAAQRWAEAGRLLSGPLASPERALEAYARSVAADATGIDALHGLRALTQKTSDDAWLVEGLVRASLGEGAYAASSDATSRLAGARALAHLAEERSDRALAGWAFATIAELDPRDERAKENAARYAESVERRRQDVASAEAALAGASSRIEGLASLARLLRSAPEAGKQLAAVLAELSASEPDDDALFAEAIRVAERAKDFEGVAALCRQRISRASPPPRVRLALVSALRRSGDAAGAAAAADGLFDACTPWAYAVAWISAVVAGDAVTRARALAALAPTCNPQVVAALSAVASEQLAHAGDLAGARRAAEQACRADAHDARALRALAAGVPASEGIVATTALERAAAVAGPTAAICMRIAEAYEVVGDPVQAVLFARRAVALRPADGKVVEALLARASRARDAEALADALTWLLPQPQPARVTAERIAPALETLAERDPARAASLSRRALDVLGPRHAPLRRASDVVADAAKDAGLRAKVVERWIAAGAPAAERGPLLLELAAHYATVGDVEREVAAYVRAARAGVELGAVRARIEALEKAAQSAEAELGWLEARAELLLDDGAIDTAAAAFRELGAAFWDTADDRPRAVQSWLRAAQLDSMRGYATLRRDLAAFADLRYAVDCLAELVEREGDRNRGGIIATEAARAAFELGAHPRALALARTALERHPSHAEALAIAERACHHIGRVQEMSPMYDLAARGALGRFGRRAAHHRAARYFEATVPMLALKHAAQAFIAVPSEGTTLALLSRTADRAQRRSVAVRTVEHVADLARSHGLRAAWLLRAATLAARDLEGARQRVDLLLKAAVLSPAPATLAMLAVASRELISLAPDDTEALAMRLERASDSLAKNLEGPDGARIAITFAEMALDLFGDAAWAWRAIERALGADGDVDEYVKLVKHADALSRADAASESLGRVVAACDKPYANVGVAMLRLVGALAAAMGDGPRSVRAFVTAAEREPDDDDIVAEADAAVTAHPEPALLERFSKKVGVYRRSQALRAIASRQLEQGDHAAATSTLERALLIAPNDAKAEIERELNEALTKGGRGEEAVLRELAAPGVSPAERAARWTELARIRQERGDAEGATDALLQAATDEPTAQRWAAVERAAEASGREHIRVQALQQLVDLATPESRLGVQKRLARAEGARGSLAAAEAAWRKVWTYEPNDSDADVAIEALLVARASYDELSDHLSRRAQRVIDTGGEKETLRAVRLRRAAILEQRLGRLDDAAVELEQLLIESPGHASALRWLCDVYERAGEPARALPALEQLAATATDAVERHAVEVRRIRLLVTSGDVAGAERALEPLVAEAPASPAALEARVEIARVTQDAVGLGSALESLARVSPEDARARSEMLVEAAQAAARAGDTEASLERAREAARLAPEVAATQLFARGLEYRLRGAGMAEDARQTIAALSRLAGDRSLEPEDVALRAFLVAEAEDVVAPGTGEQTLRACLEAVGSQPLVALGLAERWLAAGRTEDALGIFSHAVYGNLLGLRRPGRVALAAADAAERLDDSDGALRFLNEAAKDPETRVEALRRLAEVSFVTRDVARARSVLRGLADALEGGERAEVLAQLARALFGSDNPSERIEADRTMREAIDLAPPELAETLREQLATYRSRLPASTSSPPSSPRRRASASGLPAPLPSTSLEPRRPSSGAAEPAREPPSTRDPVPPIPEAPPVMVANAQDGDTFPSLRHPLGASPQGVPEPTPPPPLVAKPVKSAPPVAPDAPDPFAARVAEGHARLAAGSREDAERVLMDALREGSLEAADALDAMLAGDPARSAALLKVRRQAVELRPGDPRRLAALREAAKLDQNANYVRAIDHVLRAFDSRAGFLPPPPLSAQSTQPGMLTLLTRHSREASGEAFGVVWEGAQSLFSKPATAYGMSGVERVVPGPASTMSRLYEVALRLLDTPRFPLFHRRATGPLTLTVALLPIPAAIVAGEVKEDGPDVRWMLGHALSAVLPQNALALGLAEPDARLLWEVLIAAFGPQTVRTIDRDHANMTELLWQALGPRAQRRLKELLGEGDGSPLELVVERARQSGRRVGMFLTGDFAHAARAVVAEHAALDPADLQKPGGLAALCAELPSLADLYRLAVRPEYADARWHVPAPASMRFTAPGGLPPV